MASLTSTSSSSHLSKHYLSSKDWISSYVDSHVEIDPKSVFDGKSKTVMTPLELELMMIAPSIPTKTGTTDWMAEFYENIRGYPSNTIKPDVPTSSSSSSSSSKNRMTPLESPMLLSSCSIDVYVDNNTTSCCDNKDMPAGDDTPNFTRPSIDATFNLLKDLKKDFTNTTPDVIRSFLMSTDNAMGTDLVADRCCSLGDKPLIPSCTTVSASPMNQPIPSLDDFMKVLSSCTTSCTKGKTTTTTTTMPPPPCPKPTTPPLASKESMMTLTIHKKRQNGKRCYSKSSSNRVTPTKLYVSEIRPTDVLLGRGGRSNHHPGNIAYRKQVGDLREWYRTSKDKRVKTDLSQLLVDWVQKENSGRFLQLETTTTTDAIPENGDKWYVVNNLIARRKAAQALREHMTLEERKARKEQQRNQGLSKTM